MNLLELDYKKKLSVLLYLCQVLLVCARLQLLLLTATW